MNWKKFLLVLWKFLRLFANTLNADDKYSLLNRDNLTQPIHILLSQKQKTFSQFFSEFLKSTLSLMIFKQKMTLIADVFLRLGTPKEVIREMSKKWLFRRPFHKQHSKGAQTLLPSGRKHLNHIYWLLWRQLSWKKRSLVLRKSLRLFVDWLTADDKCSLLNKGNLKQPIQILRYLRKKKLFLNFSLHFWNLH